MTNPTGIPNLIYRAVDTNGNFIGNIPAVTLVQTDGTPASLSGGGGSGTSLADSSIVDANGVFWLVRDNGTSLSYLNWATGTSGTPTSPVAPVGTLAGEQVRATQYNATANGVAYATGDVLEHIVVLNIATNPASIISSVWLNITQTYILPSAPPSGNIVEIDSSVTATQGAGNAGNPWYVTPMGPSGNQLVINSSGQIAVSNTSFSISGTLPAFASTPTFNFPLAAGSTTSGQTGGLSMGAVTTSSPTYTTAQTNPLSLTTGGSLRGDVSSYAGTALTGTVTAYGTAPTGNVYGVNAYVSNVATIAGNTPIYSPLNGSVNKATTVMIGTAVTANDGSSVAFAGSGSVTGTLVGSGVGSGCVISAELNISALTLGTATAVFAILQESRGGTNFTDIWMSDPITTTGIVSMPAIPIAGRRRWRFFSVGGTSTTITVTISSLELPPGSFPIVRQFRDYYSATNPFASMINSVAQAASSLVLTTASSTSTVFLVEGTKALTTFMTVTGGTPTTNPVVTLQLSQDGVSWYNSTVTMTATSASTFMAGLSNMPSKYARFIVSTASSGGTAYTLGNIGIYAVN